MYISKAGVVGAGLMGSGIAQVISFSGLPVVLKDVSQERVDKGLAAAREVYQTRVKKGKMTPEELEQKMSLIQGSTSYDDFKDVDLVIEAAPEVLDLKCRIFADLGRACPENSILTTNTSSLSISAMARASGRPDKVAGYHFFYPAPVMKLIEIIPALQTSSETTDALVSFTESIRKLPVRVKECAGFLVNRLLMPYFGEALMCVEEGVDPRVVDQAMVGFGMPMGPIFLGDSLGVDICHHVAGVLADAYGPRATPPRLLPELFKEKMWGMKTGIGFYTYSDKPDRLKELVDRVGRRGKGGAFSVERLLYPMVNEAALCLDESIASPGDIDLSMMAGTGWPQPTQGLLHWADTVGVDTVLAGLRKFSKDLGPRFWPCQLLQRMVDAGWTGVKAKRGFFEYT
jgi:3-hydroxyacyl-CoA dehydrogenase